MEVALLAVQNTIGFKLARAYNEHMNAQSHTFRLRAIQNEQRAAAAPDPNIRAEWEALAIEWHALASAVSQSSGEDDQIDFA